MDQTLFWEEIKVVLGAIIQEKLGNADTNGSDWLVHPELALSSSSSPFSMRSSDCCSHRLTKQCKSHDAQHAHPGFQSTEVLTLIKQNWSAQI